MDIVELSRLTRRQDTVLRQFRDVVFFLGSKAGLCLHPRGAECGVTWEAGKNTRRLIALAIDSARSTQARPTAAL